jgi:tRNA (mo5U34)-methyltransferase
MIHFTQEELQQSVDAIPHWFHSIELPYGIVTPGDKSVNLLSKELAGLKLPKLEQKTVLDIGAWDGFYSWAAERMGASRVVSLDHFVWQLDRQRAIEHVQEWRLTREYPQPFETLDAWQPEQLPGKRGYDLVHKALNSKVESYVADFMTTDLEMFADAFDVVFFLGVLYHLKNPMEALERLAYVTHEVAIIETAAVELAAHSNHAFFEFFECDELAGDHTNWWAPNMKGLVNMCKAAGFDRVDIIQTAPNIPPPPKPEYSIKDKLWRTGNFLLREFNLRPEPEAPTPPDVRNYRAVVHAWK